MNPAIWAVLSIACAIMSFVDPRFWPLWVALALVLSGMYG